MRTLAALTAAALSASGCSLVAVRKATPPVPPQTRIECTKTPWPLLVDFAAVGGLLAYTLVGHIKTAKLCDPEGHYECPSTSGVGVGFFGALTVPFAYSIGHGAYHLDQCRDAQPWSATTPRPASAGRLGHGCLPLSDGSAVCQLGARCEAGLCVPETQE